MARPSRVPNTQVENQETDVEPPEGAPHRTQGQALVDEESRRTAAGASREECVQPREGESVTSLAGVRSLLVNDRVHIVDAGPSRVPGSSVQQQSQSVDECSARCSSAVVESSHDGNVSTAVPAPSGSQPAATKNPSAPLELSDFVIDTEAHPLGTGSFGSVYRCTHSLTHAVCVMKIMHKSKGAFQRLHWEREASSLRRLSTAIAAGAANAPQLYGAFENEESFFLAMELIPGMDMFAFLETQPKFCISEQKARLVIWQVLAVLANAHVVGVAHRDIKLENILVEPETLRTTLLDFGLSGVASSWQHDTPTPHHAASLPVMCNDFSGSLDYAAPEVAYKMGPYNAKLADVWSVGIVLFVLVFGITPFSRKQRYRAIRNRKAHPPVLWPNISHVSPEVVELIEGMLEVDPRKRLTLQQVVKHPWFGPPARPAGKQR